MGLVWSSLNSVQDMEWHLCHEALPYSYLPGYIQELQGRSSQRILLSWRIPFFLVAMHTYWLELFHKVIWDTCSLRDLPVSGNTAMCSESSVT
jgi:hypothetical protein